MLVYTHSPCDNKHYFTTEYLLRAELIVLSLSRADVTLHFSTWEWKYFYYVLSCHFCIFPSGYFYGTVSPTESLTHRAGSSGIPLCLTWHNTQLASQTSSSI